MIKVHVHWTTLWGRLPFSNLWYGLSVNICTCTETTCDVDGCRKYSTGTCIDMFQNNLVTNYSKTNGIKLVSFVNVTFVRNYVEKRYAFICLYRNHTVMQF